MLTVGVDVGGTSVRVGVVDADGAVLDTARAATPSGEGALEEAIGAAVAEVASRHRVAAVGLAVAGFVASDRRTVLFAPHLAWRQAPVADRIAERVGLPVVLEHDANAAALAEHRFGAARGAGIAVLVAIGTGIGGALLIDGKVFRGAHGVAPELGHLRLVPDGRPCPCGKNGCWERYCSGTALTTTAVELLARHPGVSTSLAREALGDSRAVTGRRIAAAARDGDPLAKRAMIDLARWLGEGLALVADVYDPEVVVIGGGVSESAPLFLDEARERYAAVVTGAGHRPLARIRTAQLGDDAGIVGVATLARDLTTTRPAHNGRR
ncbi:ROK family protein [Actinosynnema sp. NPDC047251]|uniref:Glucokinase n=1 Tax=Saccharothrix espanaensis (strain ATCC 51144 / DSM 44229 / JCM 9112 / NBRC 15066 / NRRL 15764) TaxID=1179773 RepID=K0JPM6_SACES|nr:ROK family protein [Saccharothrix espanaensis]CCH28965.1 Glucokinase [Saccharothrix espanaensis DSM 44229]